MNRAAGIAALAGLPLLAAALQTPAGTPGKLRQARLHAVISGRMFTPVNKNGAVAAVKAWFEIVGREGGFPLDSKVDTAGQVAGMRRRLEARTVGIASTSLSPRR